MNTVQTDLEKLRYPIGKFSAPQSISSGDIQRWIEALEVFPDQMRNAVRGLNDEQLDTPYRDGGWTVRQVIHHVPDSHMNGYIRFKLALTEENPTIRPYFEDKWAELYDSKQGETDIPLDLLAVAHKRWVYLLRHMQDTDWKKTFYHLESKVTRSLDVVLSLYDWHGRHHLAHVTELMKRRGWM